jgi:NADPH:quinone reductase-like Zn-dependent oxidoreductase
VKRILKWTGRACLLTLTLTFIVLFIAYWRSTNECFDTAAVPVNTMKAVRFCEYGPIDVVKFDYVGKPVPKDNQVLIKVRAASLNFIDASIIPGPWIVRLFFGLRKPSRTVIGRDVAGEVEAIGPGVTRFKPGDQVFGIGRGSLAEYACASERAVVIKPAHVSFEEAAAIPLAGLTALQGLRNAGKIQSGQKVLINGATGGVGTFAVQIAKSFGADVTAVCSTRNVELVQSIGADHVIDYTKEDYTKSEARYDMIFDNVCNHSIAERRHSLTPKGICVLAGLGGIGVTRGQAVRRIVSNFTARATSAFADQQFATFITTTNQQDLVLLGNLIEEGKVRPVIERTFKLSDAPDALRLFDQGHARGKTVITIE